MKCLKLSVWAGQQRVSPKSKALFHESLGTGAEDSLFPQEKWAEPKKL